MTAADQSYDRREALGQDDEYDPEPDWDFDPLDLHALCPLDGGDGVLLGTLGRLTHYRCRACGIGFHTPAEGGTK
jgi:hypothetical protein